MMSMITSKAMVALLKVIAAAMVGILTAHAPAAHHKGQTFRAEMQCISVHSRAQGWHWKCEAKGVFSRA